MCKWNYVHAYLGVCRGAGSKRRILWMDVVDSCSCGCCNRWCVGWIGLDWLWCMYWFWYIDDIGWRKRHICILSLFNQIGGILYEIPLEVDFEWMTCADALASFVVVTVSNGTWFVVVEQLCIEKIHRCSAVAETLNESSGQHRRSYHWLVYVHCFAEHSPIYLAETKCRQIKWKWWIQLNIPGFIQINCLLIHWRTWFKLCICRICNGTAVRGIMISSIGDLPNMCC